MPGKHRARIVGNQPFVGVDGEGGNIQDPDALFGEKHAYQLLRAGSYPPVENPQGLTFEECAEYLTSLPKYNVYVGYGFNYDVTKIIESLPEERARRLFDIKGRTKEGGHRPMPVDYGPYRFDYIPGKFFKITKRISKGSEPLRFKKYTTIYDVFSFFQSSFLAAIDKWDIWWDSDVYTREQQHAMIERGKEMRRNFGELTQEIKDYNFLECKLLEALMTEFRYVLKEIGYPITSWHGPGALAEAMLRKHEIPRKHDLYLMSDAQRTIRDFMNDGYYGGRFETTAVGPIPGPVYQYDINSAYPGAIRSLPCLTHGTWRLARKRPQGERLWIGAVTFTHPDPPQRAMLYNLPVRLPQNEIIFPQEGQGVYWSMELLAAEAAGTDISYIKGYVYEKNCDCTQFDFLQHIYDERQRLGKTTKGYTLKLGMNSLYGKFAQSIGNPQFANPAWAGIITASCRAQILRAITGHQDKTYMIATDGIFVGEKIDLPLSAELGEWEEKEHKDGMFIVQPGIYFLSSGDAKTRGIPRGRIGDRREDFEMAWRRFLESGGQNVGVDVEVDNFITARQALSRRKWSLAGTWKPDTRKVGFWYAPKRQPGGIPRWDERGAFRTSPPFGNVFKKSVPFASDIGGTVRTSWGESRYTSQSLQESERYSEQPDWVEPMFNQPE